MQEIKYYCDKCKVESNIYEGTTGIINVINRLKTIDIPLIKDDYLMFIKTDLCPKCFENYKILINEFINKWDAIKA